MPVSDSEKRKQAFKRSVKKRFKEIDDDIKGKNQKHLDALLGLSEADIKAITPDTTDTETYQKLIAIVQEATRKNIAIADLRTTITDIGKVSVAIATKAGIM